MELNKYIDHTNLNAFAKEKDIAKLCEEYFLIWFFVIISWINNLPDSSPVNINLPSSLIIPVVICSDDILLNFDISVEVKTSKTKTSFILKIENIFLVDSPLQQQIELAVVEKLISFNILYFLRRFCSGFLYVFFDWGFISVFI